METEPKQHVHLSDAAAEHDVVARAEKDLDQGKSASTAAGEFVREEIEHVREGKHGARSAKQAIAIGLSKARRAGIKLPPPPRTAKASTRRSAAAATRAAKRHARPSAKRSRAMLRKLKREPKNTVSTKALSRQAKSAARRRRSTGRTRAASARS